MDLGDSNLDQAMGEEVVGGGSGVAEAVGNRFGRSRERLGTPNSHKFPQS